MDNLHALCIPTVHINGTSRDALLSQLRQAIITATALKEFLQEGMPHPRDFCVQGKGIDVRARMQQKVRILKVETIIDDLTAIYHGVVEQEGL
jgi:hypothetical protein